MKKFLTALFAVLALGVAFNAPAVLAAGCCPDGPCCGSEQPCCK